MCEWNLIFGLTIKTSIQPFHHPGWYLVYMIFIILHKVRVACLTKYKRFNKQKKRKTKYNLCYRYTVLKLTYVLFFVYYYRVCYEMFYIIKYL